MRLALIGYGKMGKEIERLALGRGWSVDLRIDIDSPPVTVEQRRKIDVAVHFANAQTIVEDLTPWIQAQKPIVVGTTGWQIHMSKIEAMVKQNKTGLIYASNFSLGVNILFHLARTAAQLMDRFEEYDVSIQEIHHKNKLDSPSGTALTIGQILLQYLRRKKDLLSEPPLGKIHPEQLHISSTRIGAVVGTHILSFDSAADSIEIKHTAKDRSGFALGTLLAAEWILKRHGMFTMDDVFQELIEQRER
jgi:4-hydroxy-tetrahydrodipicolinate reductase